MQPQPLSPARLNTTSFVTIAASVVMFLGYSYQNAAKDHPELVAQWGNAIDWGAMASTFVAIGGAVFSLMDKKTQQHAIAQAKQDAPVDEAGKSSTDLTLRTAYDQAIERKEFDKANSIHKILSPPTNSVVLKNPPTPDTLGSEGVQQ